jgi:hypothetical protein
MADDEVKQVEATWVNVAEAAEITGYNTHSLRKMAWSMSQDPEEERPIKVRKRSNAWEMWLPDLMVYVNRPRRGPPLKSKKSEAIP